MDKKRYILTDGQESFKSQLMTTEEVTEANKLASEVTDGNLYWVELLDEPESPGPEDVEVHYDEFDRPYIPT